MIFMIEDGGLSQTFINGFIHTGLQPGDPTRAEVAATVSTVFIFGILRKSYVPTRSFPHFRKKRKPLKTVPASLPCRRHQAEAWCE